MPLVGAPNAVAAPGELFISEYIEGSSNNKALEIYNGTGAPIDLGTGAYDVQVFFNGSASAGLTINLTGTVADGDVFVLAHGSATAAVLAEADQTNSSSWFNGDDAVVLRKGTTVIDSIGQAGVDPGYQWGSGDASTENNTLRRKYTVTAGDSNAADAFDPSIEWDGFASDTVGGLGSHSLDAPPPPPPTSPDCGEPFTTIPAIQGEGPTAAITGLVATEGVVVGDHEGGSSPQIRGFYLQDPAGDGNTATSDAIFVFDGGADTVSLGDHVRVVGSASDYRDQTQLSNTTSIVVCATGASVEPTAVSFPVTGPTFLERYEGMLVTVPQPMTVTEHFQLGRFGQVVVSSGGRLPQPTNVVAPGDGALVLQAANNNRRLIIDDASQSQNPDPIVFGRGGEPLTATNTLRGGDTVTGATGVLTYTWAGNSASGNAYRLRPVNALGGVARFEAVNERPAMVPEVGGRIRVAGMNVLNYFNTFDGIPDRVDNCTGGVGGAAMDCRGADDVLEFERQAAKTVAAIVGMDAAVVGVVEIENDGYGPDSALADLVNRLNEATAPGTWGFVDVDERTGQTNALGTDAIKVGAIYQRDLVVPMGDTAVLNTRAFVTGGDSGERNRPALAQAFVEKSTGGSFVAVVNHLKSKGSPCDQPAANDGQGNCNDVRLTSAGLLADWLATDPTATSEKDVLILGDLNSYAMEDPITALRDAGYTNLVKKFGGDKAYSYVFDGQWGYLDHALATASLERQVTGVAEWHVNADEPSVLDYNTNFKTAAQIGYLYDADQFRNSDHDPVIVGLDLTPGQHGKGQR
ncbi:ExeM/NucH family extracellular endonuclease [Intrasporangium calvum]|uniref:ExeM/NucH family extracellular endonuclease n=1 Tax=Intrasporangium calvum TaxID=53358 RepID=A0ABT5GI06_9MICO|nr:ExeM/NucH family extracellular endonuclease [Intrasporangium calvum]MDC5697883.1 ExeM/NucH family extracellular endonuclease [Intrasporangium calvum]